jgi:hypothetical protein
MSKLSDQVRDHFEPRGELHQVRRALAKTMNAEEWTTYREVSKSFDDTRLAKNRTYEIDYAVRVDVVQRRLIDEAASVQRKFVPSSFGSANFDRTEINQRAQNEVRAAHTKEIAGIDKQECEILRGMLEGAQARTTLKEQPMRDFRNAADRRSSQDRRVQSWTR